MVKKISSIMLVAMFIAPIGAFAASGENPGRVVTKGYVDSGLIQKANKSDVNAVIAITDALTANDTIAKANTALQSTDLAGYARTDDLTDYARTDDLGTAAFAETTDFDAAGTAATVQTNLNTFTGRAEGFATAAQGAKADTALQAGDNVSGLVNDAGYLTTTALAGYATTEALANKADQSAVYTKTESDTLFQLKHSCSVGQMLLTGADGAVSCVDVENGTYTE